MLNGDTKSRFTYFFRLYETYIVQIAEALIQWQRKG